MKDFLTRNSPIFVVGIATLFVFLLIIWAGQKRPITAPEFSKVEEKVLITENTHILGDANAPITLVEFSDLECPFCGQVYPIVKKLYEDNKPYLRIAYRHYPLTIHKYARKAAEASEIANEKGLFWSYIAKVFENQDNLTNDDLVDYAQSLGLNPEEFRQALDSGKYTKLIADEIKAGAQLKITGTPTFYLNGEKMAFSSLSEFENLVKEAIATEKAKNPDLTSSNTSPATTPGDSTTTKPAEDEKKNDPDPVGKVDTTTWNPREVDGRYGVLEITYTDKKGFSFPTVQAYPNQTVRWANWGSKDIKLAGTSTKIEEFGDGTLLRTGTSFETRFLKIGTYEYKDMISGQQAILEIVYPEE